MLGGLLFSSAPVFVDTTSVLPTDLYDSPIDPDTGDPMLADRRSRDCVEYGSGAVADTLGGQQGATACARWTVTANDATVDIEASAMAGAADSSVSISVAPLLAPLQPWSARVTKIIDGDTFEVTWGQGPGTRETPAGLLDGIRIAGVDTNETSNHESFSAEAKAVSPS